MDRPPAPAYLDTLLLYYEEEIMGDAYFQALADRLPEPAQQAKLRKLAEVERHAAAIVQPLIDKYALQPRPLDVLQARGRADADAGPQDWRGMLEHMNATFPTYVDEFKELEAMAPAEDLLALERLTEHEVVAIAFLQRELSGASDSVAPLQGYLDIPASQAA